MEKLSFKWNSVHLDWKVYTHVETYAMYNLLTINKLDNLSHHAMISLSDAIPIMSFDLYIGKSNLNSSCLAKGGRILFCVSHLHPDHLWAPDEYKHLLKIPPTNSFLYRPTKENELYELS